jgi:phosphoribosylaminoimidazolecarboxamide formyltransferase / IMP cyclohydrolase
VSACPSRSWTGRTERVAASDEAARVLSGLRHGMNPHQAARASARHGSLPVRVISGEPSAINLLDALNGWQLVREAADATGLAAAASFKHVSPAGVALSGPLDPAAQAIWLPGASPGPLTAAYIRCRDTDPKSSFGDMIAVSEPVDTELAEFLARVVSDGIVAPGFEPGAAGQLAAKKHGTFLVLEADPAFKPPEWEERVVFGLLLEQQRDAVPLTAGLLTPVVNGPLPASARRDALLGLATVRYTQSNSVALVAGGATLGIGAGQQNRVDCVRLAAAKAATWWLRRHPRIDGLPEAGGMSRQDRLNWQIRMADGDMTAGQLAEFGRLFSGADPVLRPDERAGWLAGLRDVCLISDGYLPFRDNIDHASRAGVRYVVEPGGSARSDEVAAACAEYDMTLVRTGLRLFHH